MRISQVSELIAEDPESASKEPEQAHVHERGMQTKWINPQLSAVFG